MKTMRLGKKEYKPDERTAMMARFITPEIVHPPTVWDFDKGRRPIPIRVWGNHDYGNCVFAAQINHDIRIERVEQRQTLKVEDSNVILTYRELTGCQEPGDANDRGYVMLDGFNWWRHTGWNIRNRNYRIDAFGELDPADEEQLRLAIFLLQGIELGFWLPRSAMQQTDQGFWDVTEGAGTEPGSWGGHAVYAKKYDADSISVLTWGKEVKVSNAFVRKYCDEAWAVVDSLDAWRKRPGIDVAKLRSYLQQIGVA